MRGILKNFSRYKNKNLSLCDRFVKCEEKGFVWVDKYLELMKGKGIVNYFQFAIMFYSTKIDCYHSDILYLIANFTMDKENQEVDIDAQIDYLKAKWKLRIKDIVVSEDGKQLIFIPRFQKEFRASKFTEISPEINTIFKGLKSTERKGNCHWFSIYMAMNYINSTIVTGEVYPFAKKAKCLHSWVEQTLQDGTEVCIDLTYNLLMRKKPYYSLLHVRPLEKISREDVIKDMELVQPLTDIDGNYTKLYLSSRKEALEIAKQKEASGEIVRLPPLTERKEER